MTFVASYWEREAVRRVGPEVSATVLPESLRCVQCGLCSYSCPVNIDVRGYAFRGQPVSDGRCILCWECVERCPRGALRIGA